MEPEVVAALIGTPAVLITAAAAYTAGRSQSRGAHDQADATRYTAKRQDRRKAYADLLTAARHLDDAVTTACQEINGFRAADPDQRQSLVEECNRAIRAARAARDALDLAADAEAKGAAETVPAWRPSPWQKFGGSWQLATRPSPFTNTSPVHVP
jgi:hypothetical protein